MKTVMRLTGWVGVTVVAALALSGCSSSSHNKSAASSTPRRRRSRVERVASSAAVSSTGVQASAPAVSAVGERGCVAPLRPRTPQLPLVVSRARTPTSKAIVEADSAARRPRRHRHREVSSAARPAPTKLQTVSAVSGSHGHCNARHAGQRRFRVDRHARLGDQDNLERLELRPGTTSSTALRCSSRSRFRSRPT